jgi:hydroxyacylglutathione hydrolase
VTVIVNDSNIRIEKLTLGPYETNAYTVVCRQTGESLAVDAPARASEIIQSLNGTRPRFILLTHDHYDIPASWSRCAPDSKYRWRLIRLAPTS